MEKETEQSVMPEQENMSESEQLQQCKSTLAEWQEKYTRLTADLENYRKRTAKERGDWAHAAQAELLTDLLEIIDNFDRALALEQEIPENLKPGLMGLR